MLSRIHPPHAVRWAQPCAKRLVRTAFADPSGKTTGAIVWHIRPDLIPNWTRPADESHSQVGYARTSRRVAVLELDPKYSGPKTAKVLRLTEDGSYKQVFEGPITPPTP